MRSLQKSSLNFPEASHVNIGLQRYLGASNYNNPVTVQLRRYRTTDEDRLLGVFLRRKQPERP